MGEGKPRARPYSLHCMNRILTLNVCIHQVTDQEAVDVVRKHSEFMKHSCKELVELACRRANRDDITVMVVDLQHFAR